MKPSKITFKEPLTEAQLSSFIETCTNRGILVTPIGNPNIPKEFKLQQVYMMDETGRVIELR